MKIVGRHELWIHTHFVTDCTYLPEHFVREIRRKMDRLLESLGIVFGIHFDDSGEEGLHIVLECIPLPETMARIERRLAEIIAPIPARPRRTAVAVAAPARSIGGRRARRAASAAPNHGRPTLTSG